MTYDTRHVVDILHHLGLVCKGGLRVDESHQLYNLLDALQVTATRVLDLCAECGRKGVCAGGG